MGSLIDGSLNRFEVQDLSGLTIGNSISLGQLNNKSGGLITDVELTYVADASDGWKDWSISYKLFQSVIIKDGFSEPNAYDNADCVAPIVEVLAFAQYGNANGVLTEKTENLEANTGGFNENYNGGVNNYPVTGISWTDANGSSISAMDYSGTSNFVATITAPNQDTVNSVYNIGLCFRPVDSSIYQNKTTHLGDNLLVNAPDVDFLHSLTPDLTVYQGYQNQDGAQWDLTNLQFTQSGGVLTVSGTVVPNAAAQAYFVNFPDGERLTTIWVGIGNYQLTGQLSDRVHTLIFNEDNIDAPTVGVQIPNVVNEFLFDHGGIDITNADKPQTTTEDNLLYKSDFLLVDNVEYTGIRASIEAYNTVTEEIFQLENALFSFSNVVNINGQFQPNFSFNRNFNLPPSSDKNKIELVRKANLDVAGFYGLQLRYGWLNDWRYWLEQSNVDNDFFDLTEPFDGKNKNWQRFSNSGDWIIRLSYYTIVDGIEDFNHYEVGIRPYEDDINVTESRSFVVNSTGQTPTALLNNEEHTMTSVLTWNANYLNPWAEVTIEDKESGNRWLISSVEDHGGVSQNPLQPITGQTKLDMVIASNVATLQCIIDTNLIDVNNVCITVRIYSEEQLTGKLMTDGTLKRMTDGTIKQKA